MHPLHGVQEQLPQGSALTADCSHILKINVLNGKEL